MRSAEWRIKILRFEYQSPVMRGHYRHIPAFCCVCSAEGCGGLPFSVSSLHSVPRLIALPFAA
jgi:hypothetical protein